MLPCTQGLLAFLHDSQFLDDLTSAVAVEVMSLNDALRVVGYARVTLTAAPWGTFDGAAVVLPLPVRLYAATRAGLLRAGNDVALLLLLAGFLWSTWAPLGGPAVTWLRQRWVSWRLQRRRVRARRLLPLPLACACVVSCYSLRSIDAYSLIRSGPS